MSADAADELSEYEKRRNENIARNQKVLEALGLVRSDAELHHELRRGKGEPKAKRQKGGSAEEERAAVRRSQRLAGLTPDGSALEDAPKSSGPASYSGRAAEQDHEEARAEYDLWTQRWCGKQKGATVVGTASYAHTLMRVMTMNDTGLANRIKAIERACGQHAVAKMKLFATILALEGYVELAEDATQAYERLVRAHALSHPAHLRPDDPASLTCAPLPQIEKLGTPTAEPEDEES